MSAPPTSLAQKSLTVAGITLELHVLDNGQRVIGKDGMDALMAKMDEGGLSADDAKKVAAWSNSAFAQ